LSAGNSRGGPAAKPAVRPHTAAAGGPRSAEDKFELMMRRRTPSMHALNKLEEGGSTAASSKRHEQQFRLDLMPLQRITPTVAAAAADALELVPGYMATPSADSPFSAFGRACEDWHYGPDERPDPYLRPDSAMRQMAGSRASRGSRESHGDRPLSRNRVGTGGGLESYDYATREDLMAKGWVAPFGAAVETVARGPDGRGRRSSLGDEGQERSLFYSLGERPGLAPVSPRPARDRPSMGSKVFHTPRAEGEEVPVGALMTERASKERRSRRSSTDVHAPALMYASRGRGGIEKGQEHNSQMSFMVDHTRTKAGLIREATPGGGSARNTDRRRKEQEAALTHTDEGEDIFAGLPHHEVLRKRAIITAMIRRLHGDTLRNAFGHWKDIWWEEAEKRRKMRQVILRMRYNHLAKAFNRWRDFKDEAAAKREALLKYKTLKERVVIWIEMKKMLLWIMVSDNAEAVRELLRRNFARGKEGFLEQQGMGGKRPLHYAAQHGRARVIRMLLSEGADPMAQCTKGWTPVEYAVRSRRPSTTSAAADELMTSAMALGGRADATMTNLGVGSMIGALNNVRDD